LTHCKNFCKCHNVSPPSTTIKQIKFLNHKKRRKDLFWLPVSEISVHGHLCPMFLSLWWGVAPKRRRYFGIELLIWQPGAGDRVKKELRQKASPIFPLGPTSYVSTTFQQTIKMWIHGSINTLMLQPTDSIITSSKLTNRNQSFNRWVFLGEERIFHIQTIVTSHWIRTRYLHDYLYVFLSIICGYPILALSLFLLFSPTLGSGS
jgi:hypothetical protein